ncbi:16S rRNA (uracil(1498)-N(3))-methyltransferase [Cellvibrio sp. KY-GH-1]|uniref:16S rRNA (uracil(1498)-N(3))-methyltransferase n=1 Tax=Cellvibrio sp. KY-GH-1 TaxID=2303332 RepID=UPI0012452530|nr:16S rRNA (uracil(1498)-N(3))-methyltransferase [Cellvibrio sp. KY-GH-1]QEY17449.1 16S rRNA (uracil(1498)-N(3))-methyltransferase [Cellvibrio sp. KY-GH-1]
MRIPRIFTEQTLVTGELMQLEESASHHLSKVLRMQAGRELILFNGTGGEFAATIQEVSKKHVAVTVAEHTADNRESPLQLELAIGISRGERFEWVLQKATELGVTKITPLVTERTEVKVGGERQEKLIDRWQHIIISACEQCQRNLLPELSAPVQISDWLNTVDSDLRFVLHHRDSKTLPAEQTPQSVSLLIGPEGGLSESEIAHAQAKNFNALTLGPRVLRTETAPVAAISLVQYLWGDF